MNENPGGSTPPHPSSPDGPSSASALVHFANHRSLRLAGVLHGQPADKAVISCHGMLSNKDGAKHVLLAELLAKRGLPLLRFDFTGFGQSEGSTMDLSYSNRVDDLQAAIAFLAGRGVTRLGLFGSSMGGSVALLCAARDERVRAIATLGADAHPELSEKRFPRDHVENLRNRGYTIVERKYRIGRGLLDDAPAHNVIDAVRMLRVPLLVVHGDCDMTVPPSDARDIVAAASQASLSVVADGDHTLTNPAHLKPTMMAVAEFLSDHI